MPQKHTEDISWITLLKSVWIFLGDKKKQFVIVTIILFITHIYNLVPTLVIGWIVDFFTKYKQGDSLFNFYAMVIGLTFSWGIFSLIRLSARQYIMNLRTEVQFNIRVMGFERLMDFSIQWHDAENSGNKVQRLQTGAQQLNQLMQMFYRDIFPALVIIIGVLITFATISPPFLLFALTFIIALLIVQYFFYDRIVSINMQRNEKVEAASGTFFEGINNVLTIKSMGAKDSFKKNVIENERQSRDFTNKLRIISIQKWKYFNIIGAAGLFFYLIMIGQAVVAGLITVGTIFVFFNYLLRLYDSITKIADLIDDVVEAKTGVGRMMPIFEQNTVQSTGSVLFPKNWSTVTLHDATFNYTKDSSSTTSTLRALNLSIQRKEKIGIAGLSGGGKSTFAKILLGLYPIQSGTYKIGETDFYEIKHEDVLRHIGLVLQESEMFNLSLKENITLLRSVKKETLEKAIKIAQLESLIEKLPKGLETVIGEKGYRVSGGERQRIGIARAICKDPEILIFDEATSSLDTKTESAIQSALEKELDDKTLIIIAHRLSTLRNVDVIYVFDKGRIVESGSFDELTDNKESLFYSLTTAQKNKTIT